MKNNHFYNINLEHVRDEYKQSPSLASGMKKQMFLHHQNLRIKLTFLSLTVEMKCFDINKARDENKYFLAMT